MRKDFDHPTKGLSARSFWIVWGIGLTLWVISLLLSTRWDLHLSFAVSDQSNLYGKLVARYGEWPPWIIVIGCIGILIWMRISESRWQTWRVLAWAILLLAIIHPLVITQTIKFFWGRIRFVHLGESLQGFTPFYIPAGIGRGASFPSGHTAMAFVVSPIPFVLARFKGTLVAWISLGLVLLYGVAVSWGRILVGAHYLTDCLFSAGLSFALAAILVRLLIKRFGEMANQ